MVLSPPVPMEVFRKSPTEVSNRQPVSRSSHHAPSFQEELSHYWKILGRQTCQIDKSPSKLQLLFSTMSSPANPLGLYQDTCTALGITHSHQLRGHFPSCTKTSSIMVRLRRFSATITSVQQTPSGAPQHPQSANGEECFIWYRLDFCIKCSSKTGLSSQRGVIQWNFPHADVGLGNSSPRRLQVLRSGSTAILTPQQRRTTRSISCLGGLPVPPSSTSGFTMHDCNTRLDYVP